MAVDLLWKPSRQARGVVIYNKGTRNSQEKAHDGPSRRKQARRASRAKVCAPPPGELSVHPLAIWGLQHNWLVERRAYCSFTPLLDCARATERGAINRGPLRLTPNSNSVAATISADAARNGLKTIVFVNTKPDLVSTASRHRER